MKHRRGILLTVYRLLLVAGIFLSLGWGLAHRRVPAAAAAEAPAPVLQGPLAVYFSQPLEFQGELAGGPDGYLVAAVDDAQVSVDLAVYDIDLLSVARALLRAHQRGVAVRIVTDTDNEATAALNLLRSEGVPIRGDGRTALMHDKFVVIDAREVWAGSMNLTENCAYRNNNNLLRIRSGELAAVFTDEFEEMFSAGSFGASSPRKDPAAAVRLETGPVEAYFAPEDQVLSHVLEEIRGASTSIHFLAFSFTSDEIAAALRERAELGVDVRGVFESTQAKSNTGTEFSVLRDAGLDVRLDSNPRNMHHKVLIIDGRTVITGSYNFTDSAESRNDEDLLILRNTWLAGEFEQEFQSLYAMAAR
jgi:phosphatidylserine/phosphatidylglycerophosphate/cardiolipin synthase-like enzyme